MFIYFHYSVIYQTKMAAKMILHQNQDFKKQLCLLNTRNRCFYFAQHSLQFFFQSLLTFWLLRHACTKVGSVPGSHVRSVNMTKFLNNIPSLRGIINCTSVTFLWRFRNGWMAPVKQEDERKLTETECNKTPWGQHTHQLIKHMEQTATSDTHVSQCDQRNNALRPKWFKNMSTLLWMKSYSSQFLLCFSQLWIHDNYFKHPHVDYD